MTTTDATAEIAEGIHRCGSTHVNWYLVEENDTLTVVDTGFPPTGRSYSTGWLR